MPNLEYWSQERVETILTFILIITGVAVMLFLLLTCKLEKK